MVPPISHTSTESTKQSNEGIVTNDIERDLLRSNEGLKQFIEEDHCLVLRKLP